MVVRDAASHLDEVQRLIATTGAAAEQLFSCLVQVPRPFGGVRDGTACADTPPNWHVVGSQLAVHTGPHGEH
jgi:hypothetical protein